MGKKRTNGEGTVFFATRENRWRAQFYDQRGRRRTLSGKTRQIVERKLRAALEQRDQGTLAKAPAEGGTVKDCLEDWYATKEARWAYKTRVTSRHIIDAQLMPTLGSIKLSALRAESIERAYRTIQESHQLSPSSMSRVNSVLSAALRRAVRLQRIRINPMDSVEKPRMTKRAVTPLSASERERLLAHVKTSPREEAMIQVLMFGALRQGEMLAMM